MTVDPGATEGLSTTVWAAIATAIAGSPIAFLKIRQMFRDDGTGGAVAQAGESMLNRLEKQVELLTARCDTFAQDRNNALAAEGNAKSALAVLQTKYDALDARLQMVEKEKEALRDLFAKAEARYDAIVSENAKMKSELDLLRASVKLRPEAV
jgi:hypothetical protein